MHRIVAGMGHLLVAFVLTLAPASPADAAPYRTCCYCVHGLTPSLDDPTCMSCADTAVNGDDELSVAADRIRERMASWGLKMDYGPIPIELVDEAAMAAASGHSLDVRRHSRTTGLTTKSARYTDGRADMRAVKIRILAGLPREACEATIAHEMMHAWMFLDGQPDHAMPLEEGACNLAGYYIHQESGTPTSRFQREQMFKSPNVVYGEGLRRAIRYVQHFEFAGLVRMMRANHDFPSGF